MSIYLLQPKTNFAKSLNLISTKFTAPSREKQINEITNLWKEDSIYQELHTWVVEAQAQGTVKAFSNLKEPDITGTIIVDVPDELIDQMKRDLPKASILPDKPLDLVQPDRIATSLKPQITEEDLWHLRAIGINLNQQRICDFTGADVTVAVFDTGIDDTHQKI